MENGPEKDREYLRRSRKSNRVGAGAGGIDIARSPVTR